MAALTFLAAHSARGADPSGAVTEYQLKAAFLYHFTQFIEWPTNAFSGADSPFVIGVLGADPFDSSLTQRFAGKSVRGHKCVVQQFGRVDEIDACQILFISRSEKEWLPQMLADLKGRSALTVSEMDRFCQQGGMINFVIEDRKLRFEINDGEARNVGLKISSRVLRLAPRIIKTEPRSVPRSDTGDVTRRKDGGPLAEDPAPRQNREDP